MMELPASWSLDKISDHALIRQEKINPTLQSNEAFYLLGLENIESNTGQLLNTKMTKGTEIKSIKNAFHPNDILYGKLRPNLNKVALMSDEGICSTDIFVITCKTTIIPEYLAAYLRSNFVLNRVVQLAVGGQLPRLNAKDFLQLPIPVPPLEEQREIVAILQEAEKLRRLRWESLEKAEKLASALFIEMFGDPISNPKGWKIKKFSDTVEKLEGGKSVAEASSETKHKILKVSAVTYGEYNSAESKYLPEDQHIPDHHFVKDGDLLISRANTAELIGATAYVWNTPKNIVLSDKIWRFVWKETSFTSPLFVFYLTKTMSFRNLISQRSTGTSGSMKNIAKPKLLGLPIPIPPIELQNKFVNDVKSLRKQQQHVQAQLENIGQLLAVLQQQAFSGKLTESWRQQHKTSDQSASGSTTSPAELEAALEGDPA